MVEKTHKGNNLIIVLGITLMALLMLVSIAAAAYTPVYIAHSNRSEISIVDGTSFATSDWGLGSASYGVAVTPNGRKVYVTDSGSNTVTVENGARHKVTVGSSPKGVAVTPNGEYVYVANHGSQTVSVIDTATDTVAATVNLGFSPWGVAVNPNGRKVYVTSSYLDYYGRNQGNICVIDTATNNITDLIKVGLNPRGVAVTPDGTKVYVANDDDTVSVINTATDNVINTIYYVAYNPYGVAVSPDGTKVYVTDSDYYGKVTVIDTASDTVTAKVKVGRYPNGVAFTPDGTKAYVPNSWDANVSIIDTSTDTVTDTVELLWGYPIAFGQFIGPELTADFTWITVMGTGTSKVFFRDTSKGNPTSWSWDFGTVPFAYSTAQNPSLTYRAGTYTVKLIVKNSHGESSTISKQITVKTKPIIIIR